MAYLPVACLSVVNISASHNLMLPPLPPREEEVRIKTPMKDIKTSPGYLVFAWITSLRVSFL